MTNSYVVLGTVQAIAPDSATQERLSQVRRDMQAADEPDRAIIIELLQVALDGLKYGLGWG